MGYHFQDSFGGTSLQGYRFEINIDGTGLSGVEGENAEMWDQTYNTPGDDPNSITIPLTESESDYVQYSDDIASKPSFDDYSPLVYEALYAHDSGYGYWYISGTPNEADLPSFPSAELVLTDATNANWNAAGQLVIDTRYDTVFTFSGDFTAFANEISFYGPNDSLESQEIDTTDGTYTLKANSLIAGVVYEVELLSANGVFNVPGLADDKEKDSIFFLGETTEFQILAVPEPSTYAFFAGIAALAVAVIRRKHR